ncbi:MAG: type II toxin-antitoxin system YafQ family toxin [Bacteroidota bacterium]
MYQLIPTTRFKKDLKKLKSRSGDFEQVVSVLRKLQANGVNGISAEMRPHKLKGIYSDNWECHIKPDLLIIWFQIESPKEIKLIRVGSHSDLFN